MSHNCLKLLFPLWIVHQQSNASAKSSYTTSIQAESFAYLLSKYTLYTEAEVEMWSADRRASDFGLDFRCIELP
jgi:hypothetical protein